MRVIFIQGRVDDKIKVKLINNGSSFLFEQIRLEINGIEVDSTRILGITSFFFFIKVLNRKLGGNCLRITSPQPPSFINKLTAIYGYCSG